MFPSDAKQWSDFFYLAVSLGTTGAAAPLKPGRAPPTSARVTHPELQCTSCFLPTAL